MVIGRACRGLHCSTCRAVHPNPVPFTASFVPEGQGAPSVHRAARSWETERSPWVAKQMPGSNAVPSTSPFSLLTTGTHRGLSLLAHLPFSSPHCYHHRCDTRTVCPASLPLCPSMPPLDTCRRSDHILLPRAAALTVPACLLLFSSVPCHFHTYLQLLTSVLLHLPPPASHLFSDDSLLP